MKKIYLLFTLAFFGFVNESKAQVVIDYAYDSSYVYCTGSFLPIDFYLQGTVTGYTPADAPTLTIDFGDGTSTSVVDPYFSASYPYTTAYISHTYSASGSYDVTYIITMPDLQADTVVIYNDVVVGPCDSITGNIYEDANSNCIFDGGDNPLQWTIHAYNTLTGDFVNYTYSDVSGNYTLLVPSGLSVDLHMGDYGTSPIYVCPISGVITTSAPSSGNDFALNSTNHNLVPFQQFGFMHPGFTESISIMVQDFNVFSTPNVQLRVVVSDPLVTFVNGSAAGGDIVPDISGDTLTWDIPAGYINSYVYYYGYYPSLTMWFMTDPSAVIGTEICFDVIAEPILGDTDPSNNNVTMCFPVLNSYDPNYIEVAPHGTTAAGLIDPNLDMVYTVHFQNTGSFPATNIIVKDSLDGSVLDLSTFEFLSSSHAMTNIVAAPGGAMTFMFDNINLPDSTSDEPNSHGWFSYSIKQVPGLPIAETIENTAYIYFDFNAPITTNTALNTIKGFVGVTEPVSAENSLMLYPVPTSGLLTVITNSTETAAYQIINLNGQVVMQGSVSNGTQLSVSELTNGVYFFKLENGAVKKLIVRN